VAGCRYKERLDLLTWSAFHEARSRRRAVQWLVDNSLIDDAAANQFLASHRADSINRAYSDTLRRLNGNPAAADAEPPGRMFMHRRIWGKVG
jgi:hypothetical protein